MLRNDSKRAKFYADGAGVGTDGTPLFRSHLSVASNVASACRFLHDKGMVRSAFRRAPVVRSTAHARPGALAYAARAQMHRDLKDANVLVDGTYGRWRAKLSDFGTTADVRSMLQGQVLGTLHAMAPEVLKTVDPVGQDGVTVLADARAADVYAYGILLCALWDNGQDPLRHLKATDEWDEVQQDLPHMEPLDQVHVALQMLMCVEPFRYGDEGLRPAKPQGMPPFFWDLMKSCLVYKADKRPTFLKICEEIKAHAPAVRAPAGGPEANLRVIAVVRYKPELDRQSTMGLVFRITVSVEDRNAELTLTPSGYVSTDGEAAFAFPFAARLGQHITLSIGTPVPGAELFLPHIAEFRWVGRKSVQLPLPMAIGATQKVSITLTPNWAEQPLGGSKVALLLDVKREHESKERMLGVLSALLAAPQRTFHRLVTPGRMPHELRSDFPVEYDVMLSYRESETGKAGSNFAFRLQEALELKNLNVFAYANLAETDHWMSPQTNGVASCRVFMPIFSPEYGDLDKSPWSAAELMTAAAYLGTPGAGLSAILPVWHSGTYPPNADTRFLMRHVRGRYVPDAARYNNTPACDMRYKHVWLIVHEVLKSLLD